MTLSTYVIDASVVLKWFSSKREEGVVDAQTIYRLAKEGSLSLVAPTFLLVEVLNVLANKKHADPKIVRQDIQLLQTSSISFQDFSPTDASHLTSVVNTHKVSAYDALYITLALKNQCLLVTEDAALLKISKVSISVSNLLKTLKTSSNEN